MILVVALLRGIRATYQSFFSLGYIKYFKILHWPAASQNEWEGGKVGKNLKKIK